MKRSRRHPRTTAIAPRLFLASMFTASLFGGAAGADDRRAGLFFENEVRPILVQKCVKCHGGEKTESGLSLTTAAAVRRGGDNGTGIVPGKPNVSLVIQAVRRQDDLEMPPDEPLEQREVDVLVRWVQQGAYWPPEVALASPAPQLRGGPITDRERSFWSFQPIRDSQPPHVDSVRVRNDVDRFVIAKLRAAGLELNPTADKITLFRRACFDLTGLPPTVEQLDRFLQDESPDAFANAVNRLLDSPSYGERWGRHWLDVVRYADTAGETADYPTPHSWKYRNWVIDSFNADQPYDQFLREQIAGDILAQRQRDISADDYQRMVAATGFIAISRRFGFDIQNYHHLTIQDTIDTIGQAVLGLTLGCARCHDHKYDPVNIPDYYAWYGIFDSTRYSFPGSEEKKRPSDLVPALPPARAAQAKTEFDQRLGDIDKRVNELDKLIEQLKPSGDPAGRLNFELEQLGGQPAKPWTSHAAARIVESAQSPFTNVYGAGSRGIAFPSDTENNHFGWKIEPALRPTTNPRIQFNIDFRNVGQAAGGMGAYRFYLGRGPGNSAAVELAANAKSLLVKDGANYKTVCDLKMGRWYNLQLVVDLRAQTYSARIGDGETVKSTDALRFTRGWDGVIDQFFVDKYGPGSGPSPAREFDNISIGSSPLLPADKSLADAGPPPQANPWRGFLDNHLLVRPSQDDEDRKGFHVWRPQAGDLPIVSANASSEVLTVPGVLAPKSINVHPDKTDGVAIVWRSPLSGRVQLSGGVSDAHNCGDSVKWRVDVLHDGGRREVAAGSVDVNSRQPLNTDNLKSIEVQAGDFVQLVILPKAHYGCDMTRIDLQIDDTASDLSWKLADDVVEDFTSGNPNSDRHGNQATWFFCSAPVGRDATFAKQLAEPRRATAESGEALRKFRSATAEAESLRAEAAAMRKSGAYQVLYAAIERPEAKDARIQIRGNRRKFGEAVPRKNLEILGDDRLTPESGSGRLELADWLTRPTNPLTARVMANRIWQQHFGRGLVATANDFGVRGERPSHPELLDWLAARFRDGGWSVKSMHRLIMNSATYQQASSGEQSEAPAAVRDPNVSLLWRFKRRRLSAEEIRDAMLFVSGDLDASMGGPHPFPAVETWGFSQHTPFYAVYPTQRRSVYLMQQRLKRHPFLALFDGADPNVSTAQRQITTVPTQSLFMMNNEFVHARSISLAKRWLAGESSTETRLRRAHRMTLAREITKKEIGAAEQFLNDYRAALRGADDKGVTAEAELESWAAYARTLLVRNEFLFID